MNSMRLIFGEKELEIISKQRNNVKLTQSERNRLSGVILQKIKAIESWKPISLSKGFCIKTEINDAVNKLLSSKYGKDIKKIYLFGSHVDGTAKIGSDIDLAVDIECENPLQTVIDFDGILKNKKIDVNILSTIRFKDEIARDGKIIYANARNETANPTVSLRYRRFSQTKRSHRASGG